MVEDQSVVATRSVREAARRLLGEVLLGVGYVGELTPDAPDDPVQEVGQGVLLRTDRGAALVRWFTPDFGIGLEVLLDEAATAMAARTDTRDVSDTSCWAPLVGRTVTGWAVGWAEQDAGLPPAPWSVRIEFGADAVVIANGEHVDGRWEFAPTTVLAFFVEADARAYSAPHTFGSAWGAPLTD